MAKRTRSWQAWAIVCEGVGPINREIYLTRSAAKIAKEYRFKRLDLYTVQRVKITLDPYKTKYW